MIFYKIICYSFYLFIFGCAGTSLLHVGFSRCGEQRLLFHPTRSVGFSGGRVQFLGAQASVIVARGLGSCSSQALEHMLSSCGAGT